MPTWRGTGPRSEDLARPFRVALNQLFERLGGDTASTCLGNVEQRVEVPEPRKSTGKFLIANSNLALAA